jgi:hypothetical protein
MLSLSIVKTLLSRMAAGGSESSNEQLKRLISLFTEPSEVVFHYNADGQVSECCLSVASYFRGCIEAATSQFGLFGALDLLTKSSGWGHARCDYLCHCFKEIRLIFYVVI